MGIRINGIDFWAHLCQCNVGSYTLLSLWLSSRLSVKRCIPVSIRSTWAHNNIRLLHFINSICHFIGIYITHMLPMKPNKSPQIPINIFIGQFSTLQKGCRSSVGAVQVHHLQWASFELQLHFMNCALLLHFFILQVGFLLASIPPQIMCASFAPLFKYTSSWPGTRLAGSVLEASQRKGYISIHKWTRRRWCGDDVPTSHRPASIEITPHKSQPGFIKKKSVPLISGWLKIRKFWKSMHLSWNCRNYTINKRTPHF